MELLGHSDFIEEMRKVVSDPSQWNVLCRYMVRALDQEIIDRCRRIVTCEQGGKTDESTSSKLGRLLHLRQLFHSTEQRGLSSNNVSATDTEYDERRRAYARAYYLRRKSERQELLGIKPRIYKTSPEQREYQRTYYERKKAERLRAAFLVKITDDGNPLPQLVLPPDKVPPQANLDNSGE